MQIFPVTVIVPVHALNEETTQLLKAALSSVANQKAYAAEQVLLVIPEGVPALLEDLTALGQEVFWGGAPLPPADSVRWNVYAHTQGSDIASQVNAGVAAATTTFVTVLELDDELGLEYLVEMDKHVAAHPDTEGFLPLVASVDPENRLLKYGNEGIWVPKTEEERPDGYVDKETVEVAPDLLLSGALLQRTLFEQGAPLKASIEVSFVNEFYRRLVTRGNVLRGMGKVLYLHRERRPGSYVYELMVGEKALAPEQLHYWFEVARTESAFEIERTLTAAQ